MLFFEHAVLPADCDEHLYESVATDDDKYNSDDYDYICNWICENAHN